MNTIQRPRCASTPFRRSIRQFARALFCGAVSFIALPNANAQFDPTNPIPAVIPHGPVRVELRPIATGLVSPILVTFAPDTSGRIFVVEQTGQVWIYKNGVRTEVPFLDVASRMVALSPGYDERGLLGLAFDPGFANPESPGFRRIFTYSSEPVSGVADLVDQYATNLNHHGVVASWRVSADNADLVDPASRVELLRVDEPQSNHNGGTVAFGPDGFLYLGLGDGGGANDNNANGHNPTIGNGQDPTIALGKMLRIDVNGTNSANGKYGIPPTNPFAEAGGVREIYALGFRNPYRFSFDGNDLLVADVGQNRVEELDRVELGKNYGWRYKEGTFKFNTDGTISNDLTGVPPGLTDPIMQYDHDEGISITGGYVYRGTQIPELVGKYVFGDFSKSFTNPTGRLFYADLATGEIREFILGIHDQPLGLFVKGMGIDADGEIYVLGTTILGPSGTSGVVLKLTRPSLVTGAPVPGAGVEGSGIPEDAVISSFGVPSVNDAGEVAYLAKFNSSEGKGTVIVGPADGVGPASKVLVKTGDPVPDPAANPIAGETFRSLADPVLADGGSVAFTGRTSAPGSRDTGLWTNAGTGVLHLIAREGDDAAGVSGAKYKAFTSIAIEGGQGDDTLLAFTATLTGSGARTGNSGLWLSVEGTSPVLALRKGQTLTIGSETLQVKSFKALIPQLGAPGQGHGVADGKVLVHVSFTNKSDAILQYDAAAAFEVIAAAGEPAL
jgi:glucose/arabinose dehydrogenase